MLRNFNWKKIITIFVFLALIAVFAYGLYYFFFRQIINNQSSQLTNNQNQRLPGLTNGNSNIINQNASAGLPQLVNIPPEKISQLAKGGYTLAKDLNTDQILANSLLAKDNEVYFYSTIDNKFYKIGVNGDKQLLKDKAFYDVKNVNWAPTGDKAVIEFPDNSKILYNFSTNLQVTLPKELETFAFNKTGDEIVSKLSTSNRDSNWLVTLNGDGNGMKYIEPLGNNVDQIEVGFSVDNQIIAVNRQGATFDKQEIYPLGQNNENIPSLLVDGRGFESLWSPKDNTLIYSVYNQNSGYRPLLYLSKTSGGGTTAVFNTGLNTWTNKCVFGGTKVYCGVPQELPEYSGLFPQLGEHSAYSIYEINPSNADSTLLAIPLTANGYLTDIMNLTISGDERYLYFTNGNTGAVQSIQLK